MYHARIKRGWDKATALTTPIRECIRCGAVDHLGNEYESVRDMRRAYNIGIYTYNNRRAKGMSIEKALTTPVNIKSKK